MDSAVVTVLHAGQSPNTEQTYLPDSIVDMAEASLVMVFHKRFDGAANSK